MQNQTLLRKAYFQGVYTALVTPFESNLTIDWMRLGQLLEWQSQEFIINDGQKAHLEGLVLCGTTAEGMCLADAEKKAIIQFVLKTLKNVSLKIIVGVTESYTDAARSFIEWLNTLPIDGIMLPTPAYIKPSQEGLVQHFLSLADESKKPILLYNNPGRSGVALKVSTILELAQHPQIQGIKEASGSLDFLGELKQALDHAQIPFDILCGDDAMFLPGVHMGACGLVSVASNLLPEAMVKLNFFIQQGQWLEAQNLHQKLFSFFKSLFIESNPVPIKAALATKGLCNKAVRLPLCALNIKSAQALREILNEMKEFL